MDEQFPVLICRRCKQAKEYGNFCGNCGERLAEVTVVPGMIHGRTIPEWHDESDQYLAPQSSQ